MTYRRTFLAPAVVLAACGGAAAAQAQEPAQSPAATGAVAGRVVNAATQAPVVGARVTVVGTTLQALTRDDGRFVLPRVPAGARRVRVAALGYAPGEQPVTVSAGQPAAASFALQTTAVALSQVVVVGYGTQRREDLTGSVASISASDIQKTSTTSLQQGLQGRVPGVQVTQSDAAPGGGIRVQVRGTNSMNPGSADPLYVIDGVPFASSGTRKIQGAVSEENLQTLTSTNPLAAIAPEDVESIDILKDASATAIYGSRGANGVVIITTKKGRRGGAGQFSLNVQQGASSVVRQLDVLDAYEYASYVNRAYVNANGANAELPFGGRPGSVGPDSLRAMLGAGTNWQDLIFRAAPFTDASLGASGGDDRGSYAVNGTLLQQQGAITGSNFRRGGLRLNLDRTVTDRVRLSTNLTLTRSLNDMVRTSTVSGFNVGVVRGAVTYQPFFFRDSSSTDPRSEPATLLDIYGSNPLRYTDEVSENDQLTRGVGGVRGVVTLGKGFALDQNLGVNYERRTYGLYYPRTVNEGRRSNGNAITQGNEFGNLVSESLLRYNRDLGPGQRVDAIAGFTFQNDRGTWNSQEVQGFSNDILGGNVLQNGTAPQSPYSGVFTQQLASWLGRVNYSVRDRYLFTATVRADGSSKFAQNNKWATFPAFAFAWRAIEEPFLRDQKLLTDLKVRLSYGRSGNQAIGAYQSLAAIGSVPLTLNEGLVPSFAVTQLGNPNLRWETTGQFDAGVDFGAFANRLTGTVDVYRKNTYDLLQQVVLATNTGFGSTFVNSGSVTNRGVELLLGYDVLRGAQRGGLTWNVSANATRNANRIVSLGNGVQQQFASRLGAGGNLEAQPFIQKPGLPIGAMWGYRTDGIVRSPADSAAYARVAGAAVRVGDVKYADFNGDGKITSDDRHMIGDANPDWVWGLTNTVRVGKLDASALVTAVRGNSIINAERMRFLQLNGTLNVPRYFVENAFDPRTNPDGFLPMVRADRGLDPRFSDLYIEDGSFVRLKNVQVGYTVTLPRARTARLYVNGINLLTRTRYTGYDPEVSAFNSPDRPGVDLGSYPQQRTFTFGVNTTF